MLEHRRVWWGYRPEWAGDGAPQPINAKAEGVATSKYFCGAFAKHRCLIPANGWYEWLPGADGKQPHYITREGQRLLWFAGIFARRADDKLGCAIITEPARGPARDVHDRIFLLGGVWVENNAGKLTMAILSETSRPNAGNLNDRMPLCLSEESMDAWLSPEIADRDELRKEIQRMDVTMLTHWQVSKRVLCKSYDDEGLIERV